MEIKEKSGIYFAAMNTGDGFISFFNEIVGALKRLYIIKGGPGTGKSRLMKEIAAEAEARGYTVERFLCSSDSTSLDGIIIPILSVGIIDGTAPHAYEPFLSGAKDCILDLGRFWDEAKLSGSLALISEITNRKSRLYSGIYSYLNAIKGYDEIIDMNVLEALDLEKISHCAKKYAFSLKKGEKYEKKLRIRSAISDTGVITLNTFAKNADKRFCVLDFCNVGGIFLSTLLKETEKLEISSTVSLNPFSPSLPDAIYYPESDTVFYLGSESDYPESFINTRRFIIDEKIRPFKPKIRALMRLKREAMKECLTDFASVKRLHLSLEEIYGGAMDFTEKEKFTREFMARLFN